MGSTVAAERMSQVQDGSIKPGMRVRRFSDTKHAAK